MEQEPNPFALLNPLIPEVIASFNVPIPKSDKFLTTNDRPGNTSVIDMSSFFIIRILLIIFSFEHHAKLPGLAELLKIG